MCTRARVKNTKIFFVYKTFYDSSTGIYFVAYELRPGGRCPIKTGLVQVWYYLACERTGLVLSRLRGQSPAAKSGEIN